jgi:O-antigen/teichoic acid export membrane protein
VVESILAYFTLLDMGLAACLVRAVARHTTTGDPEKLNRMASSCLALFLAAGVVALVVGTPVLLAIAPRLEAKCEPADEILPFMLIMLANLAASLPLSLFPSILDGLQQFTAKSLVRLVILGVRTTGIVIALNRGGGLLPLALIYSFCTILEHAVFWFLCRRSLPGLQLSRRWVDRDTLRQVRTYSVDAFVAMLAGRITLQTGAIAIGLLLPAGQVTFFATASRLIDYAKSLLRQITTTLTPGVSALEARGDLDGIRRLFLTATRWVLYAVLPIQLGLYAFSRAFLERWVGSEFVRECQPILRILSVTLTLGLAQSVASRMLYGLGQLRLFARLALLEGVLNLLLLVLLIRPYGSIGVAVAVSIPNVLFCLGVLAYTLRLLNVPVRQYLGEWLKPVVASAVPAIIWLAVGEPRANWWEIFSTAGAGVLGMVAAVFLLERGVRTKPVNPNAAITIPSAVPVAN